MAGINCPMCGKSNPAGRETCQYCRARLTPVRSSSSEDNPVSSQLGSARPEKPDHQDDGIPDWLRNLRQTGADEPEEEDNPPDWMDAGPPAMSAQKPAPKNQAPKKTEQAEGADVPDWLTNLRGRTSALDESESDTGELKKTGSLWAGDTDTDWLAAIRGEGAKPIELQGDLVPPEPEKPKSPPPFRATAWDTGKGVAPEPPEASGTSDDVVPDWLRNLDRMAGTSTQPISSADQPPALPSQKPGQASASARPPEAGTGDPSTPDWLKRLQQVNTGQSQEAESITGWPDSSLTPPTSATADLPEWLKAMPTPSQPGKESKPLPGEDSTPGWLKSLGTAADEDKSQPGDLPSWLSSSDVQAVNVPQSSKPAIEFDGGEPAPVKEESGEMPDWLTSIGAKFDAGSTKDAINENQQAGPELDWLKGSENLPDESSETAVSPFASDEASQEDLKSLGGFSTPDWLAGIGPDEAGSEAVQLNSPAVSGTDLLKGIALRELAEEGDLKASSSGEEAALAPAQLPSWLEAMRPIESAEVVVPTVDDNDTPESAGPLVGLRGVLPAEPDIAQGQKPPVYPLKLQVNEAQQTHANILDEIIKNEALPRPIPKKPVVASQHVLRLTVAAVLVLAILLPLVTGGPKVNPPVLMPETQAANQIIQGLPDQAAVLVAFDYEAGFSGEMDAAAQAVLDHLMIKGAFMTVVSTVPTGPLQAERLMQLTRQLGNHTYQSPDQYINLGFIPGGAVGLLSFAEAPAQLMPYTLDTGQPAWKSGPLSLVTRVSDFSLVLVITENPDTARAWIEQVQPLLVDKPMLMVVSAQAEPLVRPYYESYPKQIQGMVTGLAGSALYEDLMGRSGLASAYWTPFSLGMLMAVMMIAVGAGVNAVVGIIARRRARLEAEAAEESVPEPKAPKIDTPAKEKKTAEAAKAQGGSTKKAKGSEPAKKKGNEPAKSSEPAKKNPDQKKGKDGKR